MSIVDIVREAGIVGCGGAGFPAHVKYNAKAEVFIVNGAECEPLLENDRYLMRTFPDIICKATEAVREHLGAEKAVILLKRSYTDEIAALSGAISGTDAKIELKTVPSFYPAGDEHVVVYEATGKTVPPGGLPLDVGAVVSNAATVYAVGQAMAGEAFTQKLLTVTGEVSRPCLLCVPIGTSFRDCIARAGGITCREYNIVCGGPMMGRFIRGCDAEEETVTKTTSAIIVVPEDSPISRRHTQTLGQIRLKAAAACTQCSYCTSLCPRNLLGNPIEVHKLMRAFGHCTDMEKLLEDPAVRNAEYCSECSLCTVFSCPMGLTPSAVSGMFRKELRKAGIRTGKLNSAGASPVREYRLAPTGRIIQRLGISEYLKRRPTVAESFEPDTVCISLSQGAGAPSMAAVSVGTEVVRGEKIACCPEGALGSDIHASISGLVTGIDGCIKIEKRVTK